MTIEKQITDLLKEQDCVIVAGLGGFIANYIPASINPVTHVFTPPSRQVAFNVALRNNDGVLANHMVRTLDISYADAVAQIEQQARSWAGRLNHGETIIFDNIGHLYADTEHHIHFVPQRNTNLLDDAFGLSVFSTQPVLSQERSKPPVQKITHINAVKSGRKLPASLKWAAILLPLAALSIWSAYNTGQMNTMYQNSATVIPAPVPVVSKSTANPFMEAKKTLEAPVTEMEIIDKKIEVEIPALPEVTVEPDLYFIIGGAFGVKDNADNLVESLIAKGYNAGIEGQNRNGLYLVSIEGFAEKEIALQKAQELRKGEFPGAWLLSKQ